MLYRGGLEILILQKRKRLKQIFKKKNNTDKNMVENKRYAKALPAKIVSLYQGKGKITFFFSFLVEPTISEL